MKNWSSVDRTKIKDNIRGEKSDIHHVANIHHLRRILNYLGEVEYDTLTGIRNKIGIQSTVIGGALKFLLHVALIQRVYPKSGSMSTKYYAISQY